MYYKNTLLRNKRFMLDVVVTQKMLHYLTHSMKTQIIFLAFPLEQLIIVYVVDIDHGITVTKPMLLEMKNRSI